MATTPSLLCRRWIAGMQQLTTMDATAATSATARQGGLAPSETRAATLWACLQRLQDEHGAAQPSGDAAVLSVHLVGADHREGSSFDETFAAFRAFSERVASDVRVRTLRLALVGPNVARALHNTTHSRECGATSGQGSCVVEVRYFVGSFDAFYGDENTYDTADLAVCFNAGIWGYDEWRPALQLLLRELRAPLLVTSYNENEAGDDEDVLDELVPAARWYWRAEKNPSGSAAPRETRNSIGSVLHENDFWMCLGAAPETAIQPIAA